MNNKKTLGNATLENVRLIYRNFTGKADRYNPTGKRTVSVLLDPEIAEKMIRDGWNVKFLKPREDDDAPQAHLPVEVSYRQRPPRVVLITERGQTNLTEETVGSLDHVTIRNVDLIINPYHWTMDGDTGVKAYLHAIYVTIEEDDLERKYARDEED